MIELSETKSRLHTAELLANQTNTRIQAESKRCKEAEHRLYSTSEELREYKVTVDNKFTVVHRSVVSTNSKMDTMNLNFVQTTGQLKRSVANTNTKMDEGELKSENKIKDIETTVKQQEEQIVQLKERLSKVETKMVAQQTSFWGYCWKILTFLVNCFLLYVAVKFSESYNKK